MFRCFRTIIERLGMANVFCTETKNRPKNWDGHNTIRGTTRIGSIVGLIYISYWTRL